MASPRKVFASASASAIVNGQMKYIKQSFRDQQELLSGLRVETIFDVGANNGDTTAVYRDAFPETLIYGFEPFPRVFQKYSERFAQDSLVKPIGLALAKEGGTHRFYVNKNSMTNSCLPAAREATYWSDDPGDLENISILEVPATTLDDFCRNESLKEVQILKLDIQGSELNALQGATQHLERGLFCLIYTEVLFVGQYEGQALFHQIADFLSRFGYHIFDIYNFAYSENGNLKWADALFVSPQVRSSLMRQSRQPSATKKIEKEYLTTELQFERDELKRNMLKLQDDMLKLQDDIDWLLDAIKTHEQESARLATEASQLRPQIARLDSEKRQFQAISEAIQNSASWRLLNKWRKVRNVLVPESSWRRRLYDSVLWPLRGSQGTHGEQGTPRLEAVPLEAVEKSEASTSSQPREDRSEGETPHLGNVQVATVEKNDPAAWICRLAEKWQEVPTTTMGRGSSVEQLRLSDSKFLSWWDELEREMLSQQEVYWVVEAYRDFVRGKRLIEVGPGTGIIGVQFLREGAQITFMDVTEPNLMLVERVCRLKGINGASFFPIRTLNDPLKVSEDYDAVFARGSLHHAPAEVVKPEFEALASRIKIGGRFLALTYPKERWVRDGSQPFNEWGKNTDGETTPWAEWYDTEKLLAQLSPYKFRTLMAFNLDAHQRDNEFNWFDLQRIS